MYQLPSTLSEDLAYFGTLVDQFQNGQIEPVKFKGSRVPMGIYEQRKDGTYMVRVRCTGGYISPSQLKQLALTAIGHKASFLHITTRQEIQIHHILIEQTKTILPELQKAALTAKGGGGNTVRNIIVDLQSGISPTETFDVLPYAVDLTTKLIAEPDSFTLPRKLKIAFSAHSDYGDLALVNDIGFVAKVVDGKRGFEVYLGGSVASNATIGWKAFDFAPEEELFYIAKAAKEFFSTHGNRKNRHKARMRYIFYKLGEEKTIALFREAYDQIKKNASLKYTPGQLVFTSKTPVFDPLILESEAFEIWRKRYVTSQKQSGLFAVTLPIDGGNAGAELFLQIAELADAFGDDTIRFTTRQNIQLRNIPGYYLGNVYEFFKQIGLNADQPVLVNNVISCTGADTCRLGICLSKGAATAIRERLKTSDLPLEDVNDLLINISGCPNSCAQQRWSDIGFSGKVMRNGRNLPAYVVYAGAKRGDEGELSNSFGTVSAKDLPDFVHDLLEAYLAQKSKYASFRDFVKGEGLITIAQLTEKYADVPAFEENPDYYFDWGSKELFSVINKGPAECSAGLFDLIDVDAKNIQKSLEALPETTDEAHINQLLYAVVFAASRMLLVTRGAEPKSTEEVFDLFISKFIKEGYIESKYQTIVELARSGANASFSAFRNDIVSLAGDVTKLYESMDDSLQFKI